MKLTPGLLNRATGGSLLGVVLIHSILKKKCFDISVDEHMSNSRFSSIVRVFRDKCPAIEDFLVMRHPHEEGIEL